MQELSLHILDLVRNSIAAGATKVIISIYQKGNFLYISISDNGKGMDKDTLRSVESPFMTSRNTRKVGLGIPLFKAAAEQSGGTFEIESAENVGTRVTGSFGIDSIDRQPLGELYETVTALIISDPDINYELRLESTKDAYRMDTKEVKDVLGEVHITEPEVMEWIREHIKEGIRTVFGGVLNEVNSGIGRNQE
ncbi:MAG: sensor histidine kinase [Clostridiaceae bacterium]|nr:sensor histidine kinase [Clostridiaceae bacterium]